MINRFNNVGWNLISLELIQLTMIHHGTHSFFMHASESAALRMVNQRVPDRR